jgi:hypothetical protein
MNCVSTKLTVLITLKVSIYFIVTLYYCVSTRYKNKHMLELNVNLIPEEATKTKTYSYTLPLNFR